MSLKNKKVLLIIGGGISSYKSLDLIRILKKNNVDIKTVLTKSGKEFVTPLSITSLTGEKVYENLFDASSENITFGPTAPNTTLTAEILLFSTDKFTPQPTTAISISVLGINRI